jgi:hypothetical protein
VLLIRQRDTLLWYKSTRYSFDVLIELFCIDVALHVASDVAGRELLAGPLNVQVDQLLTVYVRMRPAQLTGLLDCRYMSLDLIARLSPDTCPVVAKHFVQVVGQTALIASLVLLGSVILALDVLHVCQQQVTLRCLLVLVHLQFVEYRLVISEVERVLLSAYLRFQRVPFSRLFEP